MIKCQLCSEELVPGHPYKAHGQKLENYMYQFYPKVDLYSGEKIVFKRDIEGYLLTDFCNKNNLKRYLKSKPLEEQRHYLKGLLMRRKEAKSLIYAPTQVELRSYEACPGIAKFNELFNNYYDLCAELGFKTRGFNNLDKNSILKKERNIKNDIILIDTRESNPLEFKDQEVQIQKLDVGDYTLKDNNYNIYFERKEISDGISTLSSGYERFRNELIRAKESGAYIIMLVESPINDFLSFNYLPWISKKIKATPTFIAHQLRTLLQEFGENFQCAFCDGRVDLVQKMRFIMEYGKAARNIDWELASNLKLLVDRI